MPEKFIHTPADWKRHLYLLLGIHTLSHIQYAAARFTVLLLALHLQASPLVAGMLIGLNSFIPALSSVHVGRILDRSRSLRLPMLVSCIIMAAGVLLPFLSDSLVALFMFCVVVGSSFNVFRIAGQQIIGRYGEPEDRPASYNLYAQGLAAGNLVAPLLAGFSIDHLGFNATFLICALLGVPPIAVLLFNRLYLPVAQPLRTEGADGTSPAARREHGVLDLLRIPGLRRVLIAGATLMAAWDIFTFAWPLYGSSLQFPASQIGMISGVFYCGSFVVRAMANLLLRRYTQWQLMLLAMASASALFLAFPALSNFVALTVLSFILGLVLGVIQPMTMALVYEEAPPNRKGEVIGLRLTLAFGLHIAMPLFAGALGTAFGLAPVWWTAAATLMLGGWISRGQWNYRKR